MTNHGITDLIDAPSKIQRLDALGDPLNDASHAIQQVPAIGNMLRGTYMGSPMHPGVVWIPTGLALAGGLLSLRASTHRAARSMVIAGLLSTPVAVATGLSEAASIRKRGRRLASLHALTNVVGTGLQTMSVVAAREGRVSRPWLFAGIAVQSLAAMWGRHLSYNYRAELLAPLEPVVDIRDDHKLDKDHERPRDKGKSPHAM